MLIASCLKMTSNSHEFAGVFQENHDGVMVNIIVLPRSSKCTIVGLHDGALKIKLTKPPVDGEANAECCRFMAKSLGIAKSQIILVRGSTSRHKTLQINGLTAQQAFERLAAVFHD